MLLEKKKTILVVVKSISIFDEKLFSKTAVYDAPVALVPLPSFEAAYCFICEGWLMFDMG